MLAKMERIFIVRGNQILKLDSMKYLFIFLTFLLISCSNSSQKRGKEHTETLLVNKVDQHPTDTLNIEALYNKIGLYNISFIDTIRGGDSNWVLLFANNCINCDVEGSIYVQKTGVNIEVDSLAPQVVGISAEIHDYETEELVSDHSIFYGDSLSESKPMIISLDKYLQLDGSWKQQIVIYEFERGIIRKVIQNEDEVERVMTIISSGNYKVLEKNVEYTLP